TLVPGGGTSRLPASARRRFAHAGRRVHRIAVEARDHVPPEGGHRFERDLLWLGGGEHAEDELVAADVGVQLDAARTLVGRADNARTGFDAVVELGGRRLGDDLRPRWDALGAREGIE